MKDKENYFYIFDIEYYENQNKIINHKISFNNIKDNIDVINYYNDNFFENNDESISISLKKNNLLFAMNGTGKSYLANKIKKFIQEIKDYYSNFINLEKIKFLKLLSFKISNLEIIQCSFFDENIQCNKKIFILKKIENKKCKIFLIKSFKDIKIMDINIINNISNNILSFINKNSENISLININNLLIWYYNSINLIDTKYLNINFINRCLSMNILNLQKYLNSEFTNFLNKIYKNNNIKNNSNFFINEKLDWEFITKIHNLSVNFSILYRVKYSKYQNIRNIYYKDIKLKNHIDSAKILFNSYNFKNSDEYIIYIKKIFELLELDKIGDINIVQIFNLFLNEIDINPNNKDIINLYNNNDTKINLLNILYFFWKVNLFLKYKILNNNKLIKLDTVDYNYKASFSFVFIRELNHIEDILYLPNFLERKYNNNWIIETIDNSKNKLLLFERISKTQNNIKSTRKLLYEKCILNERFSWDYISSFKTLKYKNKYSLSKGENTFINFINFISYLEYTDLYNDYLFIYISDDITDSLDYSMIDLLCELFNSFKNNIKTKKIKYLELILTHNEYFVTSIRNLVNKYKDNNLLIYSTNKLNETKSIYSINKKLVFDKVVYSYVSIKNKISKNEFYLMNSELRIIIEWLKTLFTEEQLIIKFKYYKYFDSFKNKDNHFNINIETYIKGLNDKSKIQEFISELEEYFPIKFQNE